MAKRKKLEVSMSSDQVLDFKNALDELMDDDVEIISLYMEIDEKNKTISKITIHGLVNETYERTLTF